VEFDAGPRSLLYATVSTGFKAGGFFVSAPPNNSFGPETLTAYTIGSKNRFLDNRLQLNIEAFRWKYRDQQVSHLGLDGRNTSGFFTENIDSSTLMGVDIEAQCC
jgi:iron complex outermembrane receptor protein